MTDKKEIHNGFIELGDKEFKICKNEKNDCNQSLFKYEDLPEGCTIKDEADEFPSEAVDFFADVPYKNCCFKVKVKSGLFFVDHFICHNAKFQCLTPSRRIRRMMTTNCNLLRNNLNKEYFM